FVVALVGCGRPFGGDGRRKGEPVRIAAASDLAPAFTEMGAAFWQSSGKSVAFSFGSTGLLAKQISEGAPFDVFAAANVSFVDDVVREGACLANTKALYARGGLVMWSENAALLPKEPQALADPRVRKIAIANPE